VYPTGSEGPGTPPAISSYYRLDVRETERNSEKDALREGMRRVRAAIPPAERSARSARVEARLLALPELRDARTVLLFYSFGTEVPTAVLARRLLERGFRVLLPYLAGDGMEAAEVRPGSRLEATDYGPKEPADRIAVDPERIDAVITPGLAFDRRGARLGYGGGHYDRYLGRLEAHAVRIGIAFAEQVVEAVPEEELDQPVDVVVTDEEVIRIDPVG
jgi:5-formyltetrahydrofolate cyclo-ligase